VGPAVQTSDRYKSWDVSYDKKWWVSWEDKLLHSTVLSSRTMKRSEGGIWACLASKSCGLKLDEGDSMNRRKSQLCFSFTLQGLKLRALCMLSKCSTTELWSSPPTLMYWWQALRIVGIGLLCCCSNLGVAGVASVELGEQDLDGEWFSSSENQVSTSSRK
jgi:hypothetical protein